MTRPVGVILAGGRASRMGGGDKPLLPLGRSTLLAHVIERLAPQVERLALNANGDPARFAATDLPVLPDTIGHFEGPLAGILAAMEWAEIEGAPYALTVAGDTPFLPRDLLARLAQAKPGAAIVVASSNARVHPTFALWQTSLAGDLRQFLATRPNRRVMDFLGRHETAYADFATAGGDPFSNINTPDDLDQAQRRVEHQP